ncbi:MAG: hypothetical protein A2Y45_03715 [Tenericutes bacterium GWC2_34_14]|nr:MAG: Methyltransferase type 12 [candidate division TM6 bacterium GW2011_GWA2_36_9]OHE29241.1 MAG: hypothetical protein A2Y45_03715 [Tenericutes bacterium GWC2_34_14]OHE34324.1 MAG: hypothetical protein A2012_09305 [Tenericutes bacterium GWE2_34_108]OHE35676.1 MAG: hypothetical protein A2Y46_06070 [Tenericutes bacterium GWF1_35_14]OHE38891.1 MAG: hypothetical protein A2Y44_00505 [Tenericutes bacterium GWF2_35_184]OHE43923.1 MAG: hypothetical protein A2221_10400 [Tenericutes bacterium RIFOXYA
MYGHFVKYYNDIFSFDSSLIKQLLPFVKQDGKAVDLGCGTGRLVSLINDLNMPCEGVDLDFDMIQKANDDYPNYRFIEDSMVHYLEVNKDYDLILCFGNTLPHLNPHELSHFFQSLKSSLREDGTAIIQLLNYQHILKKRPNQLKTLTFVHGTFERYYTYHNDTITFRTLLNVGGQVSEGTTTLYPYQKSMLEEMIVNSGLKVDVRTEIDHPAFNEDAFYLTLIITHH